MDHKEIIKSQIDLLVQLNQDLAKQPTPEAAKEVRENIKLIPELLEAVDLQLITQRLDMLDECILGSEENEGLGKRLQRLEYAAEDHEERLRDAESRIGEEWIWECLEEDDGLPDYSREDTLVGMLERMKKLEAGD